MKNAMIFVRVLLVAVVLLMAPIRSVESPSPLTEAPTGFDRQTNGFTTQAQFELDRQTFAELEGIADGLGPIFNAQSCETCHQNPITGGISQITELRAGHYNGSRFIEQAGGSLINDRAIDASIQERVLGASEVRTFRASLNTLGDGFVECIANSTFVAIANGQPSSMRGQIIQVPVLEAPGTLQTGRFGWKNQHASLVSFSADAYLNEMGITTPLQPTENTSNGQSVAKFDQVSDPDDDGEDAETFARFMRATKAPPQDTLLAATPDAQAGSNLFNQIGCATCHVRSIATAPPGTVINGGQLTVPPALGNKLIHPFSDFLLHDVGTGDGIVQNGGPSTRNKLRTAPLWGLRTRNRLMHDGASLTRNDAILRHAREATSVVDRYRALNFTQKNQLVVFLNSL
jgi:CxxC motif-containing protein (DUF1111 family)